MTDKERYEKRKQSGMCVKCGKVPPRPNRVCCETCAEKDRVRRDETREFFKKMGLCARCGKHKVYGSRVECLDCAEHMSKLNFVCRNKNKAIIAEKARKKLAELKEKGICCKCKHRAVVPGKTYCPICLYKKRERSREERNRKRNDFIPRSERYSYGLCYRCGDKLDTDKRLCSKCSNALVENFKGKRAENHIWKQNNQLLFAKRVKDNEIPVDESYER